MKSIKSFECSNNELDYIYDIIDDLVMCEAPDYVSHKHKVNVEEFEVSYSGVLKKGKEECRIKQMENFRKHNEEVKRLNLGEELLTTENLPEGNV